jgi:hypothetical protein
MKTYQYFTIIAFLSGIEGNTSGEKWVALICHAISLLLFVAALVCIYIENPEDSSD